MTRTLRAAAAASLLVPAPAQGQAPELAAAVRGAVTVQALERHAREITRHVRPSGSPGENAATDYVVAALRAAGVPVEVHEFRAYTSNPVSARVTVPGTDFAPDAITLSFSGVTPGVEALLVDLGDLEDLPGLEMGTGERLALLGGEALPHVRGRIALVTGQPRNVPATVLEELGAVAVIFVNPEERLNELIVTSTWGTPSLLNAHRLNGLPVAQIRRSDGDRLRGMIAAREVRARVETVVDTGWKPLRLAVARVMPQDVTAETSWVLFGGHIDAWHHGGTDEGAANAAMLELALAFHANRDRMRRGLVVAWWPGHSNARYGGSTWFADHFFEELRTRAVAYVNVDGIGQTGASVFGATASPALEALGRSVLRKATEADVRVGRPGRNSDESFNGIGLPLLQLNHSRANADGGTWWWHTADDTYDKIDMQVLKTDTDLYAEALSRLVTHPSAQVSLQAEAERLRTALADRLGESGGRLDLAEADEAAGRLGALVASSSERLERAPGSPELDRLVLDVVRPIHRVMFSPGSDHHPDPGIYDDPLPGLEPASILATEDPASDRYGFALAYLLRERNRVLEATSEAIQAAERLTTFLGIRW